MKREQKISSQVFFFFNLPHLFLIVLILVDGDLGESAELWRKINRILQTREIRLHLQEWLSLVFELDPVKLEEVVHDCGIFVVSDKRVEGLLIEVNLADPVAPLRSVDSYGLLAAKNLSDSLAPEG